ncbi:MAG: TolC family outer membrane protein [Alphaproteobacteria bacterium]|nr:TolC family outer membrane protein [Alphaproteobacteria bacterium]NCQ88545.1 TolC family outer membrane protein [Alphaproteobacteria bacterium]NCT06088.1 TolC family outer membrane protein [Alphaproteobacteria bacterium]
MTNNFTKRILLSASMLAIIGFSSSVSAQQAPMQMGLSEAVSIGVMTNPEYGVVAASRRATDEELNQAKALYLPSIDFSGDTGYEYTEDTVTRSGIGDNDETLYRYEAGLTLTQMLFDGFETKYENERQKHRVQSSAHRVRETSELVGLSIVEAFLEVVRQRELLGITRENVAEHLAIMDLIQEGVDGGRSTQADLEQIKARLASARAQESTVRQQLRIAESNFRREVGDDAKDLVLPAVPVNGLTANVEEEVKTALTQSPTLDIFNSDINVAYAEYEGTSSTLYPQIDLQLNARQGENLGGVEGVDRGASALVVANWNLYRGGGDMARIREFTHRHQESKERRNDTARAIEDQVRQTWAQMVSAGEQAREFANQAAANQEVVRAYKDQFSLDRRTLLDVLDSQNELFVSRSNKINSEFLEMFAVYSLLAFKGELLPTLSVAYPREIAEIDVPNKNIDR